MDFDRFKITGGKVSLGELETEFDAGKSGSKLKKLREELWEDIAQLQEKLYAESEQSLLIVLQAMDAAGKDSTIAKLTRNLNAQGCHIHSFKKPSKLEIGHDFLWRVHAAAPAAGEIAIFNRSHYEDVLVVKVHGWASNDVIERRYQHINNFEALLADRGTKVVKFMLNISQDYQLSRFKRRLDIPGKNWKFNPGDLDERKRWGDYMNAFEIAMQKCSSDAAPWYVVPAQDRNFRDVMIAAVIRETLIEMQPEYPAPEFDTAIYTSESLL